MEFFLEWLFRLGIAPAFLAGIGMPILCGFTDYNPGWGLFFSLWIFAAILVNGGWLFIDGDLDLFD